MKKFLLIFLVNIFLFAALTCGLNINSKMLTLNLFISAFILPLLLVTFNYRTSSNILLSIILTLFFLTLKYSLDIYLFIDKFGEHDMEAFILVLLLGYLLSTIYGLILNWRGNNMFFITEDKNLSRKTKIINTVVLILLVCFFFELVGESGRYGLEIRKYVRSSFNLPVYGS